MERQAETRQHSPKQRDSRGAFACVRAAAAEPAVSAFDFMGAAIAAPTEDGGEEPGMPPQRALCFCFIPTGKLSGRAVPCRTCPAVHPHALQIDASCVFSAVS